MATDTTKGRVAPDAILDFVKKHKVADGQYGYEKGSTQDNAFLEMYRAQCGGEIRTNRGNVYKNTKDSDRLDQHARWDLRRLLKAAENPKPPRAVKGETDGAGESAEQGGTGGKRTAARKATAKA